MYYLLYRLDPDFRKFFKVKSDFDWVMRNNDENILKYAKYVATRCREEELLHFDPSGVARVIEYAARLVEDKTRLSSRFILLSDLIREAVYYATQEGKELVSAAQVEKAIDAKKYRSNQIEERSHEYIEEGKVLVDTEGAVVGQINGLTVLQYGDNSFGKPARLTVQTYVGKGNFINLEREVKMSGPIHDKGVLILSGFFGDRYAQDKSLSLSATICFEQSYAGIEGDSASSTELYALLSSLSGVPVKQGIAVTGSVNQRGMIQPIGGVNEKIEGFFKICRSRGLNGEQGVIIPIQNVKNLMLSDEVIAAVREGKFHIWAITSIDEGLEIVTGIPAGERREDGSWPEGTINYLVDQRLRAYADAAKIQSGDNNKNEKDTD
jgi:lon-related putative ATP-dependent protease